MLVVADQDDLCGVAIDPGHLTDDAEGIEHRLGFENAVISTFVDAHAMSKRIDVDVNDLCDERAFGDALRCGPDRSQAAILFVQGFELQRPNARLPAALR